MDAQTWERVQDLFAKAADLPAPERKAFLDRETANDAALRAEVDALLLHDPHSEQRIQDAIGEVVEALPASELLEPDAEDWTGRAVGAYQIVREVGRGGMGSVFEAIRNDDEFRKRVAVKVATRASFSADFRRRFRHERQILAQLEHPNIARLIDGGTTHGGLPYFAMEFVEGTTIVDFASERKLSLEARIHLFLDICSAVDYAHQNFVVHRDLKPANILVDASGAVKLLDFGIAKLLADDLGGGVTRTVTSSQLLTPDYCSPEQVRNDRITTRTDVYQLGLVLFELLTGERGQKIDTKSPGAMEKAICEIELPRASSKATDLHRAKELTGDLDNIIAMATNKDPERRYSSVAALAEDLRRQLAGLPVQARAGSFAYRAGKLLRRNKSAVAVAVLLIAAITAGVIATAYQARRAERRFAQVRSLANSFVFEIHDQIATVPGSTSARKTLVSTALRYLENLREEAAGDRLLTLELADAYLKIGDVTGGSFATSHLGDTQGAIAAYRQADKLMQTLAAERDPKVLLMRANVSERLAHMERQQGKVEAALRIFEQGVIGTAAANIRSVELLDVNGRLQVEISRLYTSTGKLEQAQQAANRAMECALRLVQLQPDALSSRNALAVAHSTLGAFQLRRRQLEDAAASFRQSVAIREQVVRADPENINFQRDLMIGYGQLGDVLGFRAGSSLGDAKGAADAFAKASAIAESLSKRDPNDRRAQADVAQVRLRLSTMLLDVPGKLSEADAAISSTIDYTSALVREDPNNYRMRYNRAFLLLRSGRAAEALGRMQNAARQYELAHREAAELVTGPDGPAARHLMVNAAIQWARTGGVLAMAEEAAKEIQANPKLLPDAWTSAAALSDLGRAFCKCGRPAEGVKWLEKGVDGWTSLKAVPQLESKRKVELDSANQDLSRCRPQ